MLFHLVDREAWAVALKAGAHRPASLAAQGFVHLSTRAQVLGTANRFFVGRRDLLLLRIDESKLVGTLKYEEGEPGQLFPHFYAALPVDAVSSSLPLLPDADGQFSSVPE